MQPTLRSRPRQLAAAPARTRAARAAPTALLKVRPYTVTSNDTLESIAAKRDMNVDDLITLNAARLGSRRSVSPGERLVLPASRLSSRDREILAGIEPGSGARFRPYPVRAGETAAAIAANRKISVADLAAANPGVDVERLSANQVIKLPPNAYSVREREMLTGTLAVPFEFFSNASGPGVVGAVCVGVAAAVAAVLFKKWRAGES